jgi:hypothetical protein
MAPPTVQFKIFLPQGLHSIAKPNVHPLRPGSDREANPRVTRDHDLGDFGYKLVARVRDDYDKQIGTWKLAFMDVTAAYATAVGMRASTFGTAQAERDADAARDALIFSLITGGAMVLLGAWVTTSLVSLKITETTLKFTASIPEVTSITRDRFTALQAAMFGGLVTDTGGKLAPVVFPLSNYQRTYPMDQPSVAVNLDADFGRLIEECAQVVRQQMSDTQLWMNPGTEFGEAWLAHANGNVDLARLQIRMHFDKLRQQWADEWQFFGKTPIKINRMLLANQFERALWADYIVTLFDEAINTMNKDPEALKALATAHMNQRGDFERLANLGGLNSKYPSKWIEAAIINRLKGLNVVIAEMVPGLIDQAKRMGDGSPTPRAQIIGSVNREEDIQEIYGWASSYLKTVRQKSVQLFFPPARPVRFEAFPSYQ